MNVIGTFWAPIIITCGPNWLKWTTTYLMSRCHIIKYVTYLDVLRIITGKKVKNKIGLY